ncbi:MAG: porin [Pseudomonadota bacterium]
MTNASALVKIKELQAELKALREAETARKKNADPVKVKLYPTPKFKSESGDFEAKFVGFMQADGTWFIDDVTDNPDGTTIRRARVGLAGRFMKDFGYKFLYDFGNNHNPALQDAFIAYKASPKTSFIVGQYKEPIGLEWQSPSKYWTFAELPAVTALTPRRSIGVGVIHKTDKFRVAVSAFGENSNKVRSDDEGYSFTGHAVFNPVHDKKRHMHVGASVSHRSPDAGSNAVSFKAKAETSASTGAIVNTGSISDVDNILLYGAEALGIFGPVMFQGEWTTADVSRDVSPDATFDSYYAQASWMMTGEMRTFNPKRHMFKRVSPARPFDPKNGDWGAVEVAVRYDSLNLNDGPFTGGEMNKVTTALNWHPNALLRWSLNHQFVETDENAVNPNEEVNIFTGRAQVDF